MSVFEENMHPTVPEQQFDRLVDGELSEADRRTLLVQLEHEPGGWRRCALAFLEAQCWKAELGRMAPSAVPQPTATVPPAERRQASSPRQSWRQITATVMTMSASFLIALVVGMGLRGNWPGVASHSPASSLLKTAMNEVPLANHETLPSTAMVPAATAIAGPRGVPATAADDWETVTFAAPESPGGLPETYRVQALRRNTLDQNMLEEMPAAIPPEVQQAFEQLGHRVTQQREIVPVQMQDGRRLVVPVDHIHIHYVGRPSL